MHWISVVCLSALIFQNTATTLLVRYSRGILQERYMVSSNVLMGEVIKLSVCIVVLYWNYCDRSIRSTLQRMKVQLDVTSSLPLCVPALCYYAQNILGNKALDHLDAFTFQALQQLRILSTAIFAIVLIRKHITPRQWRALALLCVGVSLVLWRPSKLIPVVDDIADDATTGNADEEVIGGAALDEHTAAYILGVCMVLTQASLSGFAGVYFELVLKSASNNSAQRFFKSAADWLSSLYSSRSTDSNTLPNSPQHNPNVPQSPAEKLHQYNAPAAPPNLWDRNIQLSVWSILLAVFLLVCNVGGERDQTLENGYFFGWSHYTVAICLIQSAGGLLIALVVTYTDNIVKGFAMAIAMILSSAASVIVFAEVTPEWPNIAGSISVLLSCFNYAEPTPPVTAAGIATAQLLPQQSPVSAGLPSTAQLLTPATSKPLTSNFINSLQTLTSRSSSNQVTGNNSGHYINGNHYNGAKTSYNTSYDDEHEPDLENHVMKPERAALLYAKPER